MAKHSEKTKMDRLPNTIFVRLETEEYDKPYLIAEHVMLDAIENDGPTTVGVYKLERAVRLRKEVIEEE